MSYDEICPIFQARFDENMRFLFKLREEMEEEDQDVQLKLGGHHSSRTGLVRVVRVLWKQGLLGIVTVEWFENYTEKVHLDQLLLRKVNRLKQQELERQLQGLVRQHLLEERRIHQTLAETLDLILSSMVEQMVLEE
nr:hypothetical protein [Tanacetum cinerariifolium]